MILVTYREHYDFVDYLCYKGGCNILNYHDYQKRYVLSFAIITKDINLVRFICYVILDIYQMNNDYKNNNNNLSTLSDILDIAGNIEFCQKHEINVLLFLQTFQAVISKQQTSSQVSKSMETLKLLCKTDPVKNTQRIDNQYWDLMTQKKQTEILLQHLQTQISSNCNGDGSGNAKVNVIDYFVSSSLLSIPSKRLPISDSIIMLCYKYLESISQEKKFVTLLESTIVNALDSSNPIAIKTRDNLWFKKYSKYNNALLYNNFSEQAALQALIKQHNFIKNSIKDDMSDQQSKLYWDQIVSYKEMIANNTNILDKHGSSRQDLIKYGIIPHFKKSDLFISQDTGFDGAQTYDLNGCLSDLLLSAHSLNRQYQTDVENTFKKIAGITNIAYKYHKAPVKLAARCQVKTSTDYSNRSINEW